MAGMISIRPILVMDILAQYGPMLVIGKPGGILKYHGQKNNLLCFINFPVAASTVYT